MNKLNKIMFITTLCIGSILACSSYSWMGMWMGLEINLLSFVPLLIKQKDMMSSEAALKYFVTQSLASTIMMFSIIMLSMNLIYDLEMSSYIMMTLNSSLLTKMGAAPFHFWFPEVMEGLSWSNCLIMLTWQKLAPMMLMIYTISVTPMVTLIIILCMIISGIMGLNQVSLRKFMAYSSINHIGWMLSTMMMMETIWEIYFMIYSVINTTMVLLFKYTNCFYMKQLFQIMSHNPSIKLSIMMNFLSLGGLPPFLGFLPKWLTIQALVNSNMLMLSTIMVMMTLMTLYLYIRLTFSTMLISMNTLMTSKPIILNKLMLLTFNLISILGLIICTILLT